MDLLAKLKKTNLTGRGGAGFPVWRKWEAVKEAPGKTKYLVINGSEGEPGIKKDFHILKNFLEDFFYGLDLAVNFFSIKRAFFYLNPSYYALLEKDLRRRQPAYLEIVKKPKDAGYIGGEETAVLNALENKKIEPRLRPPFPTVSGLLLAPLWCITLKLFIKSLCWPKMSTGRKNFIRLTAIVFGPASILSRKIGRLSKS